MSVFPGSNSIEASENLLALTGAQLGIWNAQRLDPESRSYLVGEVLEITGDDAIDTALLSDAIRATIGEAETMRLRMIETPDGPRQIISDAPVGISPLSTCGRSATPLRLRMLLSTPNVVGRRSSAGRWWNARCTRTR